MIIEDTLLNFGVLGVWTFVLLLDHFIDKFLFMRRIKEMLRENKENIVDVITISKKATE